MSLHFSSNQYNNAFYPKKLQNWQISSEYRERPRAFDGFTQIVANNRGHLLPGVKRCRDSPWGTFVGTWDMPLKIPGNTNPTARTGDSVERLLRSKTDGEIVLRGKLKRCKVPDPLPVKEDVKADNALDNLPIAPFETVVSGADGSLARSGAVNPEPLSTSPKGSKQGTPKAGSRVLTPLGSKPVTPALNWPDPRSPPRSAGSRRSPKVATPQQNVTTNALDAIEPELQRLSVRTPINWPSPKSPVVQNS